LLHTAGPRESPPPPLPADDAAAVAQLQGRVAQLAADVATLLAVCPGVAHPGGGGGRRPGSQGSRAPGPAAAVCLSCNQPVLPNQRHVHGHPGDDNPPGLGNFSSLGGGGGGMGGQGPSSVVNARAAAGASGALGGVTLGGGFHLDRPAPAHLSGTAAVAGQGAGPALGQGSVYNPTAGGGGGGYPGGLPVGAGLGGSSSAQGSNRAWSATQQARVALPSAGGYPQSGPAQGGSEGGGLPPLVPAPHATDTMGVMGVDGKLYRSDVAKPGATQRRAKLQRDGAPDGASPAARFPPPR
jgi:hypothetical protein